MSLEDRLKASEEPADLVFRRHNKPTGPTFEWNGNSGSIETGPLEDRPKTWDEFIKQFGLDPEEVEVVEPVAVRAWDASVGGGETKRMQHVKLTLQRRVLKRNLDELINAVKDRIVDTTPLEPVDEPEAFVIALGDLQLGKVDGDGVEGTVERFLESTKRAVERYKQLRADGWVGPIYLIHLGDCIEGFVSQGGALAWRVCLTITEQVRLYRRLLLEQVMALADITDDLTVIVIPGNHDEANRPLMTYGDSWAIEAGSAVADTLKLVPGYGHVKFIMPARDELTATVDICGTLVGFAHGHQWRAGQSEKWWADQAHGRQPIGDADMLFSAHLHHLRVVQSGVKTWIQVPALESESTWFRHRAGMVSPPGIVTAVVGNGGWSSLEIL
jgi:hypothetical protein